MKTKIRFLLFLLLGNCKAYAQLTAEEQKLLIPSLSTSAALDYSLEFNLKALGSTKDQLPLWLHSNQRGRITKNTSVAAWITGKHLIFLSPESFFLFGAGVAYNDDSSEAVQVDELFAHFQNPWLYATLGRKQRPLLYHGLSATNENILYSLNAAPLPGIQLGTSGPIFFGNNSGPGFSFSWNEYLLGNDRQIRGARLHHKTFHLFYKSLNSLQIKAGFQHFGHWGGSYSDGRSLPAAAQDYSQVITFKNNLHTNLLSYEASVSKEFDQFRLELLYNSIATDRSGRLLSNIPDGRYGIFYEAMDRSGIINSALYEFYYTKHQSHDSSGHPIDNYFNTYTYSNGWGYQGRSLAAPFFTYDEEQQKTINNKFYAHHIGIGGEFPNYFRSFPYKLLLSYSRNSGTYFEEYEPKQNTYSTYFSIRILKNVIDLNLELGTEINSAASPIFGGGVHVVYKL